MRLHATPATETGGSKTRYSICPTSNSYSSVVIDVRGYVCSVDSGDAYILVRRTISNGDPTRDGSKTTTTNATFTFETVRGSLSFRCVDILCSFIIFCGPVFYFYFLTVCYV